MMQRSKGYSYEISWVDLRYHESSIAYLPTIFRINFADMGLLQFKLRVIIELLIDDLFLKINTMRERKPCNIEKFVSLQGVTANDIIYYYIDLFEKVIVRNFT